MLWQDFEWKMFNFKFVLKMCKLKKFKFFKFE